ncbi:MAG: ThiF family adenylyltransferase [Ignavibacteriales bacterium]|nr:ThiF family adenylyltransferase [Ignavibacteriales bacterium]
MQKTRLNIDETRYIEGMLERSKLFFSDEYLEKIMNTTVAAAGFGGVGAIVVELLARWGIRRFRLLDKDSYEPSNLNRQLFASSNTIGRLKVDVAAERIKEINPHAIIEMKIPERINCQNASRLIKGADIVMHATDTPSTLLLYKVAKENRVPLVNGYSTIKGCHIQVFDYKNRKCSSFIEQIKDYFKWKDKKDITQMTDEELDELDRNSGHVAMPSLNFVTNIVGCLMVAEAIKLITGIGKIYHYPKRLNFDIMNPGFSVISMFSLFNLQNFQRFFKIIRKEPVKASYSSNMKVKLE